MINSDLKIEHLDSSQAIPFHLLELADPSRIQIESYLKTGSCYIARIRGEVVGIIVLCPITTDTIEIKNIAVLELEQGKGYGKSMLTYAEQICHAAGYKKLIIGTGNSSIGQLALYQKMGFELIEIEKNFFVKNYSKPIFENGIQCKHMLILEKDL